MKKTLQLVMMLALIVAVPLGAIAKKKEKKDDQPKPADPSNPVAALSPYILNLDELLALNRGKKGAEPFFQQASGQIVILRQEFVIEQEKAADNLKPMFAAAIKTADLIAKALEERGNAAGDINTSRSVASDGKLNEPAKKDNLTQGIHGDGLAKAVGSVVERDREKQFIARGQAQTAAGDHSMSAMAVNEWNKRAAQWHETITGAYGQIK
jgi:hypothetical protein